MGCRGPAVLALASAATNCAAYAALLGLAPAGTQGARGLIWSDRLEPSSPAATFIKSVVIPEDAVINVVNSQNQHSGRSAGFSGHRAALSDLETRDASGRRSDLTAGNDRGDLPFLPFGERAGAREVLALTFECRDKSGLFGSNRQYARGALGIGVLAAQAWKRRRTSGSVQTGQFHWPPRWSPVMSTSN